jgi:hypothetical protein
MSADQPALTRPFDGGYSDGDEMSRVSRGFKLEPQTNGDGLPIVPMSATNKYKFDVHGWLLLPGLLTEKELGPIRAHQLAFKNHPETLPPNQRDIHGGPSQVLLDHPVVAGVLNEMLSNQGLADADTYGFRFDHSGLQVSTPPRRARQRAPAARWSLADLTATSVWPLAAPRGRRRRRRQGLVSATAIPCARVHREYCA